MANEIVAISLFLVDTPAYGAKSTGKSVLLAKSLERYCRSVKSALRCSTAAFMCAVRFRLRDTSAGSRTQKGRVDKERKVTTDSLGVCKRTNESRRNRPLDGDEGGGGGRVSGRRGNVACSRVASGGRRLVSSCSSLLDPAVAVTMEITSYAGPPS